MRGLPFTSGSVAGSILQLGECGRREHVAVDVLDVGRQVAEAAVGVDETGFLGAHRAEA